MKPFLPACTLLAISFSAGHAMAADTSWHTLLDRNLSQWDTYLSYPGNVMADVVAGKASPSLHPIGLNRNIQQVFTVLDDHGTPVLRISGEIYGCAATKQEFSNYHFRAKFRWGEKKWQPRLTELRDSGLVYHSTGAFGVDYWHSWMQGQEFQIIEAGIGDYWTIAKAQIDIRASKPEGSEFYRFSKSAPWLKFAADSDRYGAVGNYCQRGEDAEIRNDWNQIDLICYADRCVHIANGKVVMALQNSRHVVDGTVVPLTGGKLQLQSEAAEVFYKDIEIRPIDSMPAEYRGYFTD